MKFRIAILLSAITLFGAPAMSMKDDSPTTSTVKRKPALPKAERDVLKSNLGFSNTVDTYALLRPKNGAPDEELIQYIIAQSPDHKEAWVKLTSPQKEWFFSSVANRALKKEVANPDDTLVTYSALRKSGNTASAEDLISYLMIQKYGKEKWGILAVPQKQWFIAKATLVDRLAAIETSPATAGVPLSAPEDKTIVETTRPPEPTSAKFIRAATDRPTLRIAIGDVLNEMYKVEDDETIKAREREKIKTKNLMSNLEDALSYYCDIAEESILRKAVDQEVRKYLNKNDEAALKAGILKEVQKYFDVHDIPHFEAAISKALKKYNDEKDDTELEATVLEHLEEVSKNEETLNTKNIIKNGPSGAWREFISNMTMCFSFRKEVDSFLKSLSYFSSRLALNLNNLAETIETIEKIVAQKDREMYSKKIDLLKFYVNWLSPKERVFKFKIPSTSTYFDIRDGGYLDVRTGKWIDFPKGYTVEANKTPHSHSYFRILFTFLNYELNSKGNLDYKTAKSVEDAISELLADKTSEEPA